MGESAAFAPPLGATRELYHGLNRAASTDLMAYAFPDVDPGISPFGSRVLVQIRRTPNKIGNIHIADETRDTQKWNTQVGKVVAIGALAFKDRKTQQTWPEGQWAEPGEFVRVPKYGGDRWEVAVPGSDEPALFAIFNDLDLIGLVTGDPLAIKAYV